MYELVVIWENGDKDVYEYENEELAIKAGDNMMMALGNQIQWFGIRKKI